MLACISWGLAAIGSVFGWMSSWQVPLGNNSSISILALDLSIIVAVIVVMFLIALLKKERVSTTDVEVRDNYGQVVEKSRQTYKQGLFRSRRTTQYELKRKRK